MREYLTKKLDWHTDAVTNQYDELPLWSSPFGSLLLENFPLGYYKKYLDIGCGTGFPLIDISQRLGNDCKAYGIDTWSAAIKRTNEKIKAVGLKNIELYEKDAAELPFKDCSFDLITSNLGINNFEKPQAVLNECFRVLKPGSSFCTTSNLNGTFKEFYKIFEQSLNDLELFDKYKTEYSTHAYHRGSTESIRGLLDIAGFEIVNQIESSFTMRFLNGSTFLNHSVITVGFIDPWRNLIHEEDKDLFFEKLEDDLNKYSMENGELKLTIPKVYFECKKR